MRPLFNFLTGRRLFGGELHIADLTNKTEHSLAEFRQQDVLVAWFARSLQIIELSGAVQELSAGCSVASDLDPCPLINRAISAAVQVSRDARNFRDTFGR